MARKAAKPVATQAATTQELKPLAEGVDESPLAYMLRIMRDPTCDPKRRDSFALKALPYCHKLLDGGKDGKASKDNHENQGPQGPTVRKFGAPVPSESVGANDGSQRPRNDGAR